MARNHRRIVRAKSQYWELIVPPPVAKPPLRHEGIRRHAAPASRPEKPLTDLHYRVLAQLRDGPKGATELASTLRSTRVRVSSALNTLSLRGLAQNNPGKGWSATPKTPEG